MCRAPRVLDQQRKRISAQLEQAEKKDSKLQLDLFNEDEKKQLEADIRHWRTRLGELESDLKLEPVRVRD